MRIGYFLSCEEYDPAASWSSRRCSPRRRASRRCGSATTSIPWNDEQGQSPFVWGVIGAISQACRLPVTTAVTAPDGAAAPGDRRAGGGDRSRAARRAVHPRRRHRRGAQRARPRRPWPSEDVRLEMLEEAVEVMRELWQGEFIYHHGRHYTVENARIYTRPSCRRRCSCRRSARSRSTLRCAIGDGFITTQPDAEHVQEWKAKAGADKPAQAGYKVCVADTEDEGVEDRAPAVGQRRSARRAVPGAAVAEALRAGQRAGDRGHDPRVDRLRHGRRPARRRRSRRTPTRGSTTSSSPTWARTTATSSPSTAPRCCSAAAARRGGRR